MASRNPTRVPLRGVLVWPMHASLQPPDAILPDQERWIVSCVGVGQTSTPVEHRVDHGRKASSKRAAQECLVGLAQQTCGCAAAKGVCGEDALQQRRESEAP